MKKRLTRRGFVRASAWLTGAATALPLRAFASRTDGRARFAVGGGAESFAAEVLALDASALPLAAQTSGFKMGTAVSPTGRRLTLDSRSLLRDGQPWALISGEFHFSRCPQAEWRDELLKVKAGAVSVVTTYIFWIHHEEVEGEWEWTGQRDLRRFVETCKEVGLEVLLRIGPWSHGEARNGGFPDWLQKLGDAKTIQLRRDEPGYLGYVGKLYGQIGVQARGLLWKDGGPVMGVQLENEFNENGGPVQHLMTLKKMAQEAGLDVPLYTCTGWGAGGVAPFGEMVPLSGAYAEGFWDRSLSKMPGGYAGSMRFSGRRGGSAAAMGAVGGSPAASAASSAPAVAGAGVYPYFTCELGAGMMASYHRRILIYPEDTESIALAKLGSGANLLGFYMYHGGQNPEGKRSYLNETQATGYWNDLPVKNYDFQASLGALGQQREHYHWLRLLGLFLGDFGAGLAGMQSKVPEVRGPLNWAVRSDGASGYVFVSHYARLMPLADREGVQFKIKLAGGEVTVPSEPVTIRYNSRFFWPLNLELVGGVKLICASAQPICGVDDEGTRYTVFQETGGIAAEFVFDGATATVEAATGKSTTEGGRLHVRGVRAGTGAAIRLRGKDGKRHVVVLLDEATALNLWKGEWRGQKSLFLTEASLLLDGPRLRLRTDHAADCSVGILPSPRGAKAGTQDGLFRRYSPQVTAPQLQAVVEQVQAAGPARVVPIAPSIASRKQGVAMQPEDADFAQAAVWRVRLPAGVSAGRDLRLRVRYTGDVLRVYVGDRLVDDDFYNGRPFEVSLRRCGPEVYRDGLVLKVLPLRADAPVYFTDRSGLKFDEAGVALSLEGVEVVETHELRL